MGIAGLVGGGLGGFLGLGIFIVVLTFIAGAAFVVLWILHSIGLAEVARKSPYASKAWMAWLPICRHYLLGLLSPNPRIGSLQLNSFPVMMGVVALLFVINIVPLVSTLLGLAFYVLTVFVSLPIFKYYMPESAVVWSIFYPLGFFVMRSRVAGRPQQRPVAANSQTPPQS